MEEKGTPKTLSCKAILRCVLAVLLTVALLGAVAVLAFAEDSATGEIETVSVSLGEDIIVKFRTTAGTGDGSKVVVVFNGETTEITENVNGVFAYAGVTPQHFNDELTATLYNAEGTQLGEAKTFSVQSYLEGLLKLEYGESGCKSALQYDAMKELAVDLLNYGAAAQLYRGEDTEHLANAGLTTEQKALATAKIAVSKTDKAVSGEAWVGAGVRFDYKLGLYFVFTAESAGEYTATINNEEVAPEPYAVEGKENCYVIRYNGFNATNMNDVVTAKLTKAGEDDQTFAYSVKSYVKAKGGDDSELANLVNATYAYGFAAVAYSAEYETTHPTFEKAGSISMDSKGYDFSSSKYGTVTLPALNLDNYTTKVVNNGTATAPNVTTTYTLKSDAVSYSQEVPSADCFELEGTLYSEYTIGAVPAAVENATLTYNVETGYTFAVAESKEVTLTKPFTAYGADLTVTGNGTIHLGTSGEGLTDNWALYCNTTLSAKTINAYAMVQVHNNYQLTVPEGSTLNVESPKDYSIYLSSTNKVHSGTTALIIDGTVSVNKNIRSYNSNLDGTPTVYVRKGTLNLDGTAGIYAYSIQVGSEKDGFSGTLNVNSSNDGNAMIMPETGSATAESPIKYAFEKGNIVGKSGKSICYAKTKANATIIVGAEMRIDNPNTTGYGIGYYGTDSTYLIANACEYSGDNTTQAMYYRTANAANTVVNYDVDQVTISGKTHKVRLVEDQKTGENHGLRQTTNIAKGYHPMSDFKKTSVDTEAITTLTATETTTTYGSFGTFTLATYEVGGETHYVWYQIIAEVTE